MALSLLDDGEGEGDWGADNALMSLGPHKGGGPTVLGLHMGDGGHIRAGKVGPGVDTFEGIDYLKWDGDAEWHYLATRLRERPIPPYARTIAPSSRQPIPVDAAAFAADSESRPTARSSH